ncbi:MAG: GntR family transcriptional regulator [Actinoallomurus sp.]
MREDDDDDDLAVHPEIDYQGPRFLYVQVADLIERRIRVGDLRPGDRLPAERDLADEYHVAYYTIRRAMELLRERDLVVSVHGRGTFVKAPAEEA